MTRGGRERKEGGGGEKGREKVGGERGRGKYTYISDFKLHKIAILVMLMASLETIHVHLVPGVPHAMCNHNWLIAVQYESTEVQTLGVICIQL